MLTQATTQALEIVLVAAGQHAHNLSANGAVSAGRVITDAITTVEKEALPAPRKVAVDSFATYFVSRSGGDVQRAMQGLDSLGISYRMERWQPGTVQFILAIKDIEKARQVFA